MRLCIVLLALFLGLSSCRAQAPAPAPGPAVPNKLDLAAVKASCGPEFAKSLASAKAFTQAIAAAGLDALPLDVPADGRLLLVIPIDAGFDAALADLGITKKSLLTNSEQVKGLLAQHILFSQADNAQALPAAADPLSAAPVWLFAEGGPEPGMMPSDFFAAPKDTLQLMFGVKEIPVTQAFQCSGNVDAVFVDAALSPTPKAPLAEPDGIIITADGSAPSFARAVRGLAGGLALMDTITASDTALAPLQADGSFSGTVGDLAALVRSSCGTAGARELAASCGFLSAVRAVKDEPVNFNVGAKDEAVIVVPSDAALERYAADQGTTFEALLSDRTAVEQIIARLALAVNPDADSAEGMISQSSGAVQAVVFSTGDPNSSFQEFMNAAPSVKAVKVGDGRIPVKASYQCSNGVNLVYVDSLPLEVTPTEEATGVRLPGDVGEGASALAPTPAPAPSAAVAPVAALGLAAVAVLAALL